MGRVVKRVTFDFNWPIGQVWEGYLNPHRAEKCSDCDGSGYAPEAKLFSDQWYGNASFDPDAYGAVQITIDHPSVQAFARGNVERHPDFYGTGESAVRSEARRLWILWRHSWCHHLIQADVDALVEEDRLWDFTRVPINGEQREVVRKKVESGENSWLPENNGRIPTSDEVNAWSMLGAGHDAINQSICIRYRCEREGVPYRCAGSGDYWETPELKKANEEWEASEPPDGPGYQLWETTSEGSPQSPVFSTLDDLCRYAALHCTTFGSSKATAEEWRKVLDDGFVRHGNMLFI